MTTDATRTDTLRATQRVWIARGSSAVCETNSRSFGVTAHNNIRPSDGTRHRPRSCGWIVGTYEAALGVVDDRSER